MDKAHKETDRLLFQLQFDIAVLYRNASKKIQREIKPLIEEMQLDDETATQEERLIYANKTNKKLEAVKIITDIITQTNEKAAERINQNARQIYALNFKFACDNIIKQIKDSM